MESVAWGILGVSGHFMKRMIIPWMRAKNAYIHGIASRDPAHAEEVVAEHRFRKAYKSYTDLLADSDIQAVYIPLPNHMHYEWIVKAADAGKHVLCEKPLCMNLKEAQAAAEHCKKRGVLLMEAFMYKLHPQWRHLKELLQTNEIGQLQAIQTNFFFSNHDPKNIRNIASYGGGAIYDIGCYAISSARFIVGRQPQRVLALSYEHPSFKVDVLSSGCLDFGDVQAVFSVGTTTFGSQSVTIFGSEGRITVELPFNTFVDVPARIEIVNTVQSRVFETEPTDQYLVEIEEFSQAALGEIEAPISVEDALENMEVIDAYFASQKKHGWVNLG